MRVRSFIPGGVPPTHTSANPAGSPGLSVNGLLQRAFIPDDPNHSVTDLNSLDDRPDPGLAKGNIPGRDVLAHGAPEAFERCRIESRGRCMARLDEVKCGPGLHSRSSFRLASRSFRMSSRLVTPASTIFYASPIRGCDDHALTVADVDEGEAHRSGKPVPPRGLRAWRGGGLGNCRSCWPR